MTLVITGASGYIGTRLVDLAAREGHELTLLTRNAPTSGAGEWIPYDLCDTTALALPPNSRSVVHLAFNPNLLTQEDADAEFAAAMRILDASSAVGARFVFVSSQTARQDAPTLYGRTKWRIEQIVLQRGGKVVRPGQVYGGSELGLFGLLVKVVRSFPLLPAFYPSPKVQPVHVDDLALALLRVSQLEDLEADIFAIAQPAPVSFTAFIKAIAAYRLHKVRLYLPVPTMLVSLAKKVLGKGLSNRIGLTRLDSLFDLSPMDSSASLDLLGLRLRTLHLGMQPERAGVDQLWAEAKAMLHYVLKQQPDNALIGRYIGAVSQFRQGRVLGLPRFAMRRPALIALLDDRTFLASDRGQELAWRLDAATLLAEATRQGGARFIGINQPAGTLKYFVQLVGAVVSEIFWRIARLISMPLFLKKVLDRSFP